MTHDVDARLAELAQFGCTRSQYDEIYSTMAGPTGRKVLTGDVLWSLASDASNRLAVQGEFRRHIDVIDWQISFLRLEGKDVKHALFARERAVEMLADAEAEDSGGPL